MSQDNIEKRDMERGSSEEEGSSESEEKIINKENEMIVDKSEESEVEAMNDKEDDNDGFLPIHGEEKGSEKPKSEVRETVILSGFSLSRALWKDEEETEKWITMQGKEIEHVTTSILAMMDREVPTNFVVLVYQSFVGVEDIVTLEEHMSQIQIKANSSELHELVIPTIFNRPIDERIWGSISALNQHIRILCLDMGRPMLNLHKAMLSSSNNGKIQYIRPQMWHEYQNRTGIGATLSFEGLTMIKNYLKKYLNGGGFEQRDRPASKVVAPDMVPPPLCYTNGYKGNDQMMDFIKEAGLRTPARPTGNQKQKVTKKAVPMDKSTPTPQSTREKRGREEIAKAARKRLDLSSDDDVTEEERRTRRFLEAKKKLGKKRGEDTDSLTKELNNMRIEGIKASKRSREKYENFEKKIKDLEGKISEKDKRLKKLNENEKRLVRLEDKLDEKYEVIKKLRADLAEADVEIEEWKEAYEEEKEARDDEREAYDELHQKFSGLKRKRRTERESS